MVYYIRSRHGYEEFLRSTGLATEFAIWIDNNILEEEEISDLRQRGFNVTNFTVGPEKDPDVLTIREHHPREVIWIEF